MKLNVISEAYDKNLGEVVAKIHGMNPLDVKAWVRKIDEQFTYAAWILKQLKENELSDELQDEFKLLLKRFDNAKEYAADDLFSTDINRYTLDSLRMALATYEIKGEVKPEAMEGVIKLRDFIASEGYGIGSGGTARIRAYLISNANALESMASDQGWCVRRSFHAEDYIKRSPQIMIYRNNEPITLAEVIDQSEDTSGDIRNSQNGDERRMEIRRLVEELRNDDQVVEVIKSTPRYAVEATREGLRWPEAEPYIVKDGEALFAYLIKVGGYAEIEESNWPEGEKILFIEYPDLINRYLEKTGVKGRNIEAEAALQSHPEQAAQYVDEHIEYIETPIPELEEAMLKHCKVTTLLQYAGDVLNRRWFEAEPRIMNDCDAVVRYAEILVGRWQEAEPAIKRCSPYTMARYAIFVLKSRWKEAEPIMLRGAVHYKNFATVVDYAKYTFKNERWPELEKAMLAEPAHSSYHMANYAVYVLKGPWPEAEPAIAQNDAAVKIYAKVK